jgi:flavin reductase (DIM6/NTAB) family NADH-FMN oxidoreductase RutF
MEKIQMPNQAPAAPMPVVIAGTLVKGKENYLTIGAYGVMSIQPPLVYISSMKAHFSNAGIKETGYFSINVPPAALVKETDYCGLVSGRDTDKSTVFSGF